MRRIGLFVCACALLPVHPATVTAQGSSARVAPTGAAAAARLPVRRVVLYKSGVGYFEHVGQVRGNQSVAIDFNSTQLDDVLKSLTTIDLGSGRIGNVSFNSEAPLAERLGAQPLPLAEHATRGDLLDALRGARLEVRSGGGVFTGRLLSVEARPRGKDAAIDELTLVGDGGQIRTIDLTPAVSVRIVERESSEQVGAYLGLIASSRSQTQRRMTIATIGAGARDVLVGYVSEVPVWKTTYRIVLPEDGQPLLQGWAIVDNTIGEDWNGVELSLVAGAPQSFIQPLSQPQYVRRPVVPVSRLTLPTPQAHAEAMSGEIATIADSVVPAARPAPRMEAGKIGEVAGGGLGGGVGPGIGRGYAPGAPPMTADEFEQAMAASPIAAQARDLGDLFEYHVSAPITIHRNQSALVPILKSEIAVERVSLWNARTGTRPLRALWLTNASGLTLDAGSFTVLDAATFAGEGLVDAVKPGEKRLLSYAVDLGVQVDSRNGDDDRRTSRVKIARGVVVQTSEQRARKVYTIRNNDATPRTVVVEHPIRAGWTLIPGVEPAERSLSTYRFTVPVAAKSTATLTIDERHPIETQYQVVQLTDDQLAVFVRDVHQNPAIAGALAPIAAAKAALAAVAAQIASNDAELAAIGKDQDRLRENMRALKGSAGEQALLRRYVAQLNQQEDRLAALRQQREDLARQHAEKQAELAHLIEALSIDVDLDAR